MMAAWKVTSAFLKGNFQGTSNGIESGNLLEIFRELAGNTVYSLKL